MHLATPSRLLVTSKHLRQFRFGCLNLLNTFSPISQNKVWTTPYNERKGNLSNPQAILANYMHTETPDTNNFSKPKPTANFETWIATLSPGQQDLLLNTLLKHVQSRHITEPLPLTSLQLIHVGFHYSLPFIGFGFLDNFIMIIAGDYIDLTVGTMLGISTMAAAGIGNAISDVAGVGSAQFVESLTQKLGVPQPNLEPRHYAFRSTTWAINMGRAIGVAIGCLLGMIPLLFLPTSEDKKLKK